MSIPMDPPRRAHFDDVPADRYGRPLIIPPGGGELVPYTSMTTFISAISNPFGIDKWEQRRLAVGLAENPKLAASVLAYRDENNPSDKRKFNETLAKARDLGKASEASDLGTAMHRFYEKTVRGQDPGPIPEGYEADVDAWMKMTEHITWTHIEQRLVLDPLGVSGTTDLIGYFSPKWFKGWKFPDGTALAGKKVIADSKTGKMDDLRIPKVSRQEAGYARSQVYDPDTGKRTMHNADIRWGLVIWSPAGQGHTELIWVDLLEGWRGVQACKEARRHEALTMSDLTVPFGQDLATQLLHSLIDAAESEEALIELWNKYEQDWTDQATKLAKARKKALLKAS